MSALAKYDAARYALSIAVEVDEVKDIRDKAEAMAAYARQAKDTELVQWATEIKVRAERRAGQMLAEMPKAQGELRNSSRSHDGTATKTLADIGITKNESSRWQKLAAVTDTQFEEAVQAAKEVAGEVTTAAMLRAAKACEPTKPAPPPAAAPATDPAKVEPEIPEDDGPSAEELAAHAAAEAADRELVAKLLDSDEPLAALAEENKQLKAEIAQLKLARDGYMNQCNEAIALVKARDRQIAKLEKMMGTPA